MSWSIETYRLDEVEYKFPLPCVVKVNEGYHSLNDAEEFSRGDILSIDKKIVLHKVAAHFVFENSGSTTTNTGDSELVNNEILIPLNYKGRLKVLRHLKNYDSIGELAQDFPRYAKLRETFTVRTEDKVSITIQPGTVVELDRIIPGSTYGSKKEPDKLVMLFNHLNTTVIVRVPFTDKCKFRTVPDKNKYTIKDVIDRFSLPQLVKFVEDKIRRVYTMDHEDLANMRTITETMRLNRLLSQTLLVGHYKPVEEFADGVQQSSLIVLPLYNEEIREIKVNILKGATEDDYADIFMERNVPITDDLVVDGSLYVDFAEVKPGIKRFIQRDLKEIPPPLPTKTKKRDVKEIPQPLPTKINKKETPKPIQRVIPVATRYRKPTMSASKKWSQTNTYKGEATSSILAGLQSSSLRSPPRNIDNKLSDSNDSGGNLKRLRDVSTMDSLIEANYKHEDYGDWLISQSETNPSGSTDDRMQSYAQDDILKEEEQQAKLTKEGLWQKCIILNCRKYGYRALKRQEYPDQRTLDKLSKQFGKRAKLTLKICDKISYLIRSKDDSIVDVCATVREGSDNIVFVIIVNKRVRLEKLIEYSFVKRRVNEVSNEGKEVIDNKNFDNFWTLTSNASRKKLRRCIHKSNIELMKNHRYLMMISGSPVRSKGYNSPPHKIEREMCLVLYVLIKGYIPIQEEPFKRRYFGVPVDVREGCFFLCTGPANHFQDSLKIGCQIQREELGTGTLGGFIDYHEFGTCGITCAHVLLHEVELKNLAPTTDNDMELGYSATGHIVYQPEYTPCHRNAFGKIVKAIFREGGDAESGIDIAVFKVEQRFPFLGEFPALNNGSRLNMSYDSGRVVESSRIVPGPVIKFGAQSNLTEGSFVTEESTNSVKTSVNYESTNPYKIILHNLLEIRPSVIQHCFAEPGDSGGLVFCKGENNELICVGVVEGGTTHGTCIVMPISPILEQLNVTTLKSFEANKTIEQRMEEKLTELRSSISYEIVASEERTSRREEQRSVDMQDTIKQFMGSIVTQSEQRVLNYLKKFENNINTKSQPQ